MFPSHLSVSLIHRHNSSEVIKNHAGIRIYLDEAGYLSIELKSLNKPMYRQSKETAIKFPLDRWVEVKAHFYLSDREEGVIEVWQDQVPVIKTNGVTLPIARAIYNSLEIGISAHSFGNKTATLWVDDIEVSNEPIE
jgi:hypothetical protein